MILSNAEVEQRINRLRDIFTQARQGEKPEPLEVETFQLLMDLGETLLNSLVTIARAMQERRY